jgi:hypothetical protein
LEGSEKVLPHDRTDEKGDQAESHPKDQIDPPEVWGVKKILTKSLKHGFSVGENVR